MLIGLGIKSDKNKMYELKQKLDQNVKTKNTFMPTYFYLRIFLKNTNNITRIILVGP